MQNKNIHIIEIGLLNKCNLKCPLCSRQIKTKNVKINNKNILDIKLLIKTLDYFPFLNHVKLVGAVSEPTLYPDLFELLRYLKNRKISISISTNGSTHNIKWWKQLGTLLDRNDQIIFAIDGSTQDIHHKYRVGSNLKKILENHKSLKNVSQSVTICQFIKFNYNISDINNVEKLSIDEKFDKFKPINCYMFDKKYDNNFYINDIENKYKLLSTNNDIIDCQTKRENFIYLNFLGELLPCCFINDLSLTHNYIIPNIYTSSLDECFNYMITLIESKSCCSFYCGKKNKMIQKIFKLDP